MDYARCDIIIPVFNKLDLTKNCLESICRNTLVPFNMILIDNGSDPETASLLERFKAVNRNVILLKNQKNLGWVKAINQGMRVSLSPYVCIMNNDTIVKTKGWLSGLISVAGMDKDIGLVNPTFELKKGLSADDKSFIEIDFCRGYCILIKREVIEKIGLFDEAFGLGYYDDDDYSVRTIRAGFRCVRANNIYVEHLRDSTFSEVFDEEKRMALHYRNKMLFYTKWGMRLKLIFIITKEKNREGVAPLLLTLARRQHLIHLWNMTAPFSIPHLNIREKKLPAYLYGINSLLALYFNKLKKRARQYDLIFVDNEVLHRMVAPIVSRAYYVDMEKDIAKITDMTDKAAKVRYEK